MIFLILAIIVDIIIGVILMNTIGITPISKTIYTVFSMILGLIAYMLDEENKY